VTGEGIDALLEKLEKFVGIELGPASSPMITRARHRHALAACRASILAGCVTKAAPELRAEELRRAADALGRITGRVDVEDLLEVIFREFCIGK
jgi:tRNA modification GTPase